MIKGNQRHDNQMESVTLDWILDPKKQLIKDIWGAVGESKSGLYFRCLCISMKFLGDNGNVIIGGECWNVLGVTFPDV